MSIPDPNMVHFKPNLSGKFTDGKISIIALYQQKNGQQRHDNTWHKYPNIDSHTVPV